MGGMFSGRKPSKTTKPCPEQFISLDVRELQRDQLLEPGQAYNLHQYTQGMKLGVLSVVTHGDCLELKFIACDRQAQFASQFIEIAWTPCHFGGYRPWFLCPGEYCGRRVAILYGPTPNLCRHCWRIAYQSQRENQIQRMFRKLRSIEASYPGQPNNSTPETRERPKGMHHRTFDLLQKKHRLLIRDIQLTQVAELIKLEESLPEWY
ncbi:MULTISPECIES: hypothetical protein [Marinobacter]|uniref:hypothetical protein n=1 Tax=Marinobacter TaxID=2742 RepID=UPI002586BB81|nr:hypothetical protein [Marinobacter salarius]WOI18725.1 hypothetical protein R1T46_18470 [Marinobacter salarius]